jgi:hypothetical protein
MEVADITRACIARSPEDGVLPPRYRRPRPTKKPLSGAFGRGGGTRTPADGFGDGVIAEGKPPSTFRLPGSDVGGTIGIASTAWGRHGETVSKGS